MDLVLDGVLILFALAICGKFFVEFARFPLLLECEHRCNNAKDYEVSNRKRNPSRWNSGWKPPYYHCCYCKNCKQAYAEQRMPQYARETLDNYRREKHELE